ncbi:MAG: type II toxin-antitoxin system death-on-curing family toxin [Rhodospirillales bacterium]|jgi:death-on-curing protein|nr:type II toxin-antitoxin system death-on-curing family toxin [Rhodospirillaceae bacterium]MDP6427893.1 type II toxin-antitoxin system death-on-curing family toxin [Rhodospirillales bacterium]MDP6644412.1 type II toxin-antitoxin system death-on-curing family toxin [Rhodospirillales bacterium]MDP6841734.1 type II toxin-antitoxin system death-on-curing family toxin [Rhodospirillales bacterium]|tara:strand:+ start:1258 stop:1650 length:393 start_codon:yes stop_codon:yes gene_type:complete
MAEPRWLSVEIVLALHEEQLALFGGGEGVRDLGLLDSALARPRNLHGYAPDTPLPGLAASLAYGIIRNHPFVDGNKRTGLLAIRAFMYLNGFDFEAGQAEEVAQILSVAAGEIGEEELASWIAANAPKRS